METAAERLEQPGGVAAAPPSAASISPAVEALARRGGITAPARTVVVVGTNGKTSTATFLARLLQAAGLRVGLTVSPHLRRWSERVLDRRGGGRRGRARRSRRSSRRRRSRPRPPLLRPADARRRARSSPTAASTSPCSRRGSAAGSTPRAVLRPQLVVLTGIGLDHTELLGPDEPSILREKLGVAPAGAVVVSAPLGAALEAEAVRIAASAGFRLEFPPRRRVDVSRAQLVARPRCRSARRRPAGRAPAARAGHRANAARGRGRSRRRARRGAQPAGLAGARGASCRPATWPSSRSRRTSRPPALRDALRRSRRGDRDLGLAGPVAGRLGARRASSAARRSTTRARPRARASTGRASSACRSSSSARRTCSGTRSTSSASRATNQVPREPVRGT